MTEKRKPHFDLDAFKDAFSVRCVAEMTIAATRDAVALGLELEDVRSVVLTMRPKHFYKSMTSYADHRVWQDVYHVPSEWGVIYLKYTTDRITEFRILSFKDL